MNTYMNTEIGPMEPVFHNFLHMMNPTHTSRPGTKTHITRISVYQSGDGAQRRTPSQRTPAYPRPRALRRPHDEERDEADAHPNQERRASEAGCQSIRRRRMAPDSIAARQRGVAPSAPLAPRLSTST